MGVMQLKYLFSDVKFSFRFAQTHLNVGMPSLMRSHAARHRTDIDRIRQTDTDASALARFKDSIRNNHTAENANGNEDYRQMVDILIRRGGLLDHYAGPKDIAHWAEAKNLKEQFKAILDAESASDAWDKAKLLGNNRSIHGALSVAATAVHSAVTEIQATTREEVTPAVLDAILTTIVGEFNSASVEVQGEKISVADFKKYLHEVGDGIASPNDFKL